MRWIFFTVVLFLSAHFSYSQEYSKLDTLQTGRLYKVILFDDSEISGTLISQDSLFLTLRSELKATTVRKDDILTVSEETSSHISENKFIVSGSGGLSILVSNLFDGDGRNYRFGFGFHASGLYLMDANKGIGMDFSYSRFKRVDQDYYSYWGPPPVYEGGDQSLYDFKLSLAFGNLSTRKGLFGYGKFGAGLSIWKMEPMTVISYSTWDSSYYTYTHAPQTETYLVISAGGAGGYWFTRNFSVIGEIEYNMMPSTYFFFFGVGYFQLRLGASYHF